jgi:hypothetical protein
LRRQQIEIKSRIAAIDALDPSIPHAEEESALTPTGIGHQIKILRLLKQPQPTLDGGLVLSMVWLFLNFNGEDGSRELFFRKIGMTPDGLGAYKPDLA